MQTFTPFLMFVGRAEEAMNFYVSVFANSQITSITRYGPSENGAEGSVLLASFSLNGRDFLCIDSPVEHAFTFTPSLSVHVTCETEAEVDEAFAKLAEGGEVLMELAAYPFSKRFGWLNDKFGVSWQLMLADE